MRVYPPLPLVPEPSYLVCVPRRLIPLLCGTLATLEARDAWASDSDWQQGYTWIVALQAELMSGCVDRIVESQDRIYRLLDSALNGTAYSAVPASAPLPATAPDPTKPTISPAIPDVPVNSLGIAPGLRKQLLDAQGTLPAGWFGWGEAPATTADLVRALRNDSQQQIDRVKTSFNALQTLAQGATVFDVVGGFLSDGAEITAEGGILATLIVSTMAQAAMLGTMAGQIDRLIASLDGGGLTGPADNVLLALRGTLEASETRNVIDAIASDTAALTAIADNTFNTAGNTGAIAASTATIDGNISAMAVTLSNIDNNTFNIATNTLNTTDDTALLASLLTDVRTLLT